MNNLHALWTGYSSLIVWRNEQYRIFFSDTVSWSQLFFIWQLNGTSSSSAFCCLDRRCPPQNIKLPGKHIDQKHSLLYFTGSIWSHFYYYTKYKWEITEQSTPETTMMYEIMSKTLLDDFVASSGRPVSSVWWCGRGVKVPERPHRQLAELENQHRECI